MSVEEVFWAVVAGSCFTFGGALLAASHETVNEWAEYFFGSMFFNSLAVVAIGLSI